MSDEQEKASSPDMFQDVLDFHQKLVPQQVRGLPSWPSYDIMLLRGRLVQEEFSELVDGIQNADFIGIADNIADCIYVLIGMSIAMGIDLREVWKVVHAANMAKEGGPSRPDGKVMKPEGWKEPDVVGVITNQKNFITGG